MNKRDQLLRDLDRKMSAMQGILKDMPTPLTPASRSILSEIRTSMDRVQQKIETPKKKV